jgi:hypothetical protein
MTDQQLEEAIIRYKDAGFDRSAGHRMNGRLYMRIGCSACEVVIIMGKACHETGCPNSTQRRHDADTQDN